MGKEVKVGKNKKKKKNREKGLRWLENRYKK